MNDATRKGASAPADATEEKGVDKTPENQEDSNLPSEHPLRKRQSVYDRFEQERTDRDREEIEDPDLEEEPAPPDTLTPESEPSEADPLAAYVELKDGKPFFKTVIDGEPRLVPLDRAQAQLQKHEAADLRLQRASETLRSVEARDEALALREREALNRSPSQDVNAETDAAIEEEAASLIESLMNEDEEEAAKRLTAALKKARSSGEPLDRAALVTETAEATTRQLRESEERNLLQDGFNTFMREYGDSPVNQDPKLRAWHAVRVDELAAEHSDWTPKQVMLEAGRLACEFAGIEDPRASETSPETPSVTPVTESEDEPNPRTERKRSLQPMPESQSARAETGSREAPAQTPRDILNEMRKSRGQPVAR